VISLEIKKMELKELSEKKFPDIVTKAFIFEAYMKSGMPEKHIRATMNIYIRLMGGNVRKKKLNDIVVINIIADFGLPMNYKISDKLEKQFAKLGYIQNEYGYIRNSKC
jgi:hypothetical protein